MSRETNLDTLRGLGAVAVVLLHAPPLYHSSIPLLKAMGWGLREVCQIAVPMFFLISGYLSGRRSPELPGSWRLTGRLLRLYVPWFLFYLGLDLWQGGHDVGAAVVVRRFLGLSTSEGSTTGYHLWFLPAMMWGFLFLGLSVRFFRSVVPAIVAGLVAYAVVGWRTFPDADLPWHLVPHEFAHLSLLFLGLGFWHGKRVSEGIGGFAPRPWMLATAVVWLLAEGYLLGRIGESPWMVPAFQTGRIVLPLLILLWATSVSAWRLPRWMDGGARILGATSTGIYVLHIAVLELIPFRDVVENGFIRDNVVRWTMAVCIPVLITKMALRYGKKWIRLMVT